MHDTYDRSIATHGAGRTVAARGGGRGGRWRLRVGVLLTLTIAAVLVAPAAAHAGPIMAAISGTETNMSRAPGDQYDQALAATKAVYTDYRNADTDVWWYDFATGINHPVIVAPGNQELTGISGDLIVYTDYRWSDVAVYDTVTGVTTDITAADKVAVGHNFNSIDPAISGSLVAWEDSRDGNMEIYAKDLVTGEERRVTDDPNVDAKPAISGTTIVWQRARPGGTCGICVYDWSNGASREITYDPTYNSRNPDVEGNAVVYQTDADGTSDVVVQYLDSGTTRVLVLPGYQANPHISGDCVSFDDLPSSDLGALYSVKLWYLPTDQVFDTGSAPTGQGRYLNDIFMADATHGRVAYTDDRNGDLEVYSYDFELTMLRPRIEVTSAAVHFGDVALGASAGATVTVKNSGATTLTVASIGLTDAGVGVTVSSASGMPAEVAPGGTFDVGLTFAPSIAGPIVTALTVSSDDPDTPLVTVPVDGRATAPDIAVSPAQVQFGDVGVGKSTTALVAIQNIGNAVLNVTCALDPAPAGVSLTPVSTSIAPGASYDVPLAFAPTAAGPVSGALKISTNVPGKAVVSVSITGNGVATELPPSAMIKDLLAFYDASVAHGTLTSVASGRTGKLQLVAMRAMIEASGDLMDHHRNGLAKLLLESVHLFCDGKGRPADLVTGPARAELDARVLAIIARL